MALSSRPRRPSVTVQYGDPPAPSGLNSSLQMIGKYDDFSVMSVNLSDIGYFDASKQLYGYDFKWIAPDDDTPCIYTGTSLWVRNDTSHMIGLRVQVPAAYVDDPSSISHWFVLEGGIVSGGTGNNSVGNRSKRKPNNKKGRGQTRTGKTMKKKMGASTRPQFEHMLQPNATLKLRLRPPKTKDYVPVRCEFNGRQGFHILSVVPYLRNALSKYGSDDSADKLAAITFTAKNFFTFARPDASGTSKNNGLTVTVNTGIDYMDSVTARPLAPVQIQDLKGSGGPISYAKLTGGSGDWGLDFHFIKSNGDDAITLKPIGLDIRRAYRVPMSLNHDTSTASGWFSNANVIGYKDGKWRVGTIDIKSKEITFTAAKINQTTDIAFVLMYRDVLTPIVPVTATNVQFRGCQYGSQLPSNTSHPGAYTETFALTFLIETTTRLIKILSSVVEFAAYVNKNTPIGKSSALSLPERSVRKTKKDSVGDDYVHC